MDDKQRQYFLIKIKSYEKSLDAAKDLEKRKQSRLGTGFCKLYFEGKWLNLKDFETALLKLKSEVENV